MTDTNDVKTNNPFETNSTSLLKAGIAASPFAAGIGIGAHRLLNDGIVAPRASAITDTLQTVRKHPGAPARLSYNDHLNFMNRAHESGMFQTGGAGRARSAWVQAMQGGDSLARGRMGNIASNIGAMGDTEVVDALMQLSKSEGRMTQGIFGQFRRNFEALSAMGGSPMFTSVQGISIPVNQGIGQLPLAAGLQEQLTGMTGPGKWRSEFFSRAGFFEEGLGQHRIGFGVGGKVIEFNLPITQGGVLVSGATSSSRYISPGVGIIDPTTKQINRISREQFFLQEIQESIITDIHSGRLKTQGDVNKALTGLYDEVFSSLESIPNAPTDLRLKSLQDYQDFRGAAIDLYTKQEYRRTSGTGLAASYRRATTDEVAEMIERHGLFAGTGEQGLAKGRVQTTNLALERSLFPEAVDWGRKIESSKRQFQLTEESAKALAGTRYQKYRDYETLAARQNNTRMQSPHLKVMYVNPDQHQEVLERIRMGDGEALGRKGMTELIEHESIRSTHLKTVTGSSIDEFTTRVKAGDFAIGDVLGFDEAGSPVIMKKNMRLMDVISNKTKARGEFMTMFYSDTRRMQNNAKWFGDFKALMRLTDDMWFRNQASSITHNDQMLTNLDVIVSMDELKKDPSKFAKQVLTSMTESVRGRGALVPESLSSDFALRPRHYASLLQEKAITGGAFSTERFALSAMGLARELGFTQQEFGSAFGALPHVFGEEKTAQLLGQAVGNIPGYAESISGGVAGGVAQIISGGPEELRGAGRMGSLEPRAFGILKGPAFGELGSELQAEFSARMIATDPEKLGTHRALTKTLASIAGAEGPGMADKIFNVAREYGDVNYQQNFQRFIEEGGGYIRPGKGLHDIYVPGAETTLKMRPFTTAGGIQTSGTLAGLYHDIAGTAGGMYGDITPLSEKDAIARIQDVAQDIHKQQAAAGKGMGAFLRGKVKGSRFLTGVSSAGGFVPKHLMEVGLPESYAKQMFAEMSSLGMYSQEALGAMEQQFAKGEAIGGIVARHPFIGDYSMQQVMFRRAQTTEPQLVIPEMVKRVRVQGGGPVDLTLGPLVGMAGDKDADLYSAMLVSPDAEKAIRKNIMNLDSEFVERYTQHQIRYQMLKAGKAGDEVLPTVKSMIGGARKLSTVPEWVPRLSVQMSEAKAAVRRFGSGAAAADAAMLLEWLEQAPISAKHLSASQAYGGELSGLLQQMSTSFEQRDVTALEEVVSTITKGNKVSEQFLKGNISLHEEDVRSINKAFGRATSSEMKGLDLRGTISNIMSSLDNYRSSGAAREDALALARGGRIKGGEIAEYAAKAQAAVFSGTDKGTFASVSAAASAMSNRMGQIGQSAIKHARPVGFGFAGMLALGAILSTPEELVGPGARLIPKAGVDMSPGKSADRMKPEDLHPTTPMGRPTAPDMLRQRKALIAPMANSRNFTIRSRAGKDINVANVIGNVGGGSRRINVNLQDDRRTLNPHIIANKMS